MVRQGYIIWLDFDPQIGYEQKGRRPALVVSNTAFSIYSKFAIVCPITTTITNLQSHIELDSRTQTTGVILCDHVKSIDIRARKYKFIEVVPQDILLKVIDTIGDFMDPDKKITTINTKG
jgi:mRNA interferase MazF